MTAKAALCKALLDGKVVSIKTGFRDFGITNIPREIGRSVERIEDGGFGVLVSRTERHGISRYGQPTQWTEYRLNQTEYNKEGIEKMKAYVASQMGQEKRKDESKVKEQTNFFGS